jgi:xylulokinase
MYMRHVIGCDIGTQALKAVLWREDGRILGYESVEYPIRYPYPAWAEQDVAHWWAALKQAIPRLYQQANVRPDEIVAIGIDGTVDGVVPVSENGAALSAHILWMDRRAAAECDFIRTQIDPGELFQIAGLNIDATHTAAKMLWLRNHHPGLYRLTWKLMPSTSYIVYCLTGRCLIDYAQASSTMLFDVRARQWSDRLLQAAGINPDLLPEIVSATYIVGALTPQAARDLGLNEDTLVIAGSGDEHAACVGAGALEPGIVVDLLGTAEPVCTAAYTPLFDQTRLVETHSHAHPDRWLLENPGFVSGGNYRWLRDTIYAGSMTYEQMNQEAAQTPAGSDGLIFLPFMMGAMAPAWNDRARGVFYGLTLTHSRAHLTRAVLEGAAYALRSIIEAMQAAGAPVREIRVVGGGAQSTLMCQIRADVLGLPVVTLSTAETTVIGAALLAAVGAGIQPDLQAAADLTTHVVHITEPNPANRAVYDSGYKHFLRLCGDLKDSFEANPFL